MKEKINVDKLVKELNKGDVAEQVAVLKFLKEQVAQKLQAKQEELAELQQQRYIVLELHLLSELLDKREYLGCRTS